MRVTLLVLLSLVCVAPAAAQGSDRWQITLENGQYIWDIRLVRLAGDSLVYRQADTLGKVTVAEVTELRLIRKTTVHAGDSDRQAETMAALMGGSDEIFDFRTLDFAGRLRAIQQLFLLHPPAP